MCKVTNTFYFANVEPDPVLVEISKRFIPRVILLCAIGRSQFYYESTCVFDGKIGL